MIYARLGSVTLRGRGRRLPDGRLRLEAAQGRAPGGAWRGLGVILLPVALAKRWRRVLRALLARPHINRFEAERDPAIRDHTLPSTVAELARKGVRIDRQLVKVPGFQGAPAIVAQYSLADDQRSMAARLLATGGDRGRP